MYTQCPECSTAFRVTATVLKQAAGKVRCGGCGNAFNALEYLSETMPDQPAANDTEENLPELKPEPLKEGDGLPASISAEQSAALLKTLDELAGSDIRIEDTGVEWRVLDDEEIGDSPVDEILEESPTPVDQFLTETPPQIDVPEIFDEEADASAPKPVDELRFDDNTPLPEDFDFEDASPYTPAPDEEPEADEPIEDATAEPQPEVDLSEPDEWTDILDEFEDLGAPAALPLDEELAALDEEIADDVPDEPEEGPADAEDAEDAEDDEGEALLDMDTQFALQAEAMGIDLSGIHETADDVDETAEEAEQLELIDDADELPDDDEPDVPPISEEEHTINMQIDADLMAIAVEDEDGFASTIIIPGGEAEEALLAEAPDIEGESDDDLDAGDENAEVALKDTSAGFETIIMEGDHIRSGLDGEQAKEEEDRAAAAALVGAAAAEREAERQADNGGRRRILLAGAVALALLFALQAVHQNRDALAKIPAFNNVVGPIYRVIGRPLAPEWDITGWRFEATRGSTDDGEQNLTIFSRLGNKLDEPLPYPLIAISLTDRFEETIGSRILDPSDYLASDLDPERLVQPGNTFNAVMTIAAPDPEATGFKLNVCYRDTGGDLRCAIDDFK